MKIADMKVTELINAVGSDAPAPGGGPPARAAGPLLVADRGECRAGGTERLSPKGNFVRIHVSNIGC